MNTPTCCEIETVCIRPMEEKDLARVVEIDQMSFQIPWPERVYKYELHENPLSLLWVAEYPSPGRNNEVIGMVVVWLIVDEAHIATIAVHPDFRNQGIAQQILAFTLQEIIKKGMLTTTLEVRASNQAAQRLYRRFKFQVVGVRPRYYRDNNEDALIMTVSHHDLCYANWLHRGDWHFQAEGAY